MTKVDRDSQRGMPWQRQGMASGEWSVPRRVSAEWSVAPPYPGELAEIVKVLERFISSVNARLLVERALREKALTIESYATGDLPRLGSALRRGVQLFVKPTERKAALEEVDVLCGPDAQGPVPCGVDVKAEGDIVSACNLARRMCEEAKAKSFATHKVMTIVSELGRNVVSYAGGGKIEFTLLKEQPARMVIRASDEGPGIDNIEEILAGRYTSKTGLGKGILGTKRLADRFDISTNPTGTVVIVEIKL